MPDIKGRTRQCQVGRGSVRAGASRLILPRDLTPYKIVGSALTRAGHQGRILGRGGKPRLGRSRALPNLTLSPELADEVVK